MIRLTTNDREEIAALRTGDVLLLSGTVYTARDAAHKRFFQALEEGESLPSPLRDAFVYFAGPTPTQPGRAIGSCGPTTSSRMDRFSPRLYDLGLFCTIGKGERSKDVQAACARNHSVYLCAVGGAGALAAQHITACEVVAYEDLGCESVKRLTFSDFPLTVAIDARGVSLFDRKGRDSDE